MYRLLAHLADPAAWSAAVTDSGTDVHPAPASGPHGHAASTLHPTREHGSLLRARMPRLHETW
jgi:hypothetical protein